MILADRNEILTISLNIIGIDQPWVSEIRLLVIGLTRMDCVRLS
jgi:hypothetical protein